MSLLRPTPPPYDPLVWSALPFAERSRQVCRAWALQGYGAPGAVYLLYGIKIALYVGGWLASCALSPELGGPTTIASWWSHPVAFQKAIVWSLLFEIVGLGCGSGPLTGRYWPPVGGFLYFLRPGTTKLPLFEGAPAIGRSRRGGLDVVLYAALLAALVRVLVHPSPGSVELLPIVGLVPCLGVLDRTLFLAARAEHYWATLGCCALMTDWIPGAQWIQAALWFWAGVSKLNAHFPSVVCVMTSNGPLTRSERLRRGMYRGYPDDLRPARLAVVAGHAGTALELAVPLVLVAGTVWPGLTALGLVLMLTLHVYITSHVPMGVPLEWNVMVAYGGAWLFGAHREISPFEIEPWPAALALALLLIGAPLLGNLVPGRLSFLLSMRYYAGNWPWSVWLFRGETHRKLDRLTRSAPWVVDQLERFYDRSTALGLIGKVIGFRMMHLHGRALHELVPRAVDDLGEYTWLDGELVAGMVLGWNFGDGHLHQERLLRAVQSQCGFEEGELRCIFVESQPLGRPRLGYRVWDACRGSIETGSIDVRALVDRQPWPEPERRPS